MHESGNRQPYPCNMHRYGTTKSSERSRVVTSRARANGYPPPNIYYRYFVPINVSVYVCRILYLTSSEVQKQACPVLNVFLNVIYSFSVTRIEAIANTTSRHQYFLNWNNHHLQSRWTANRGSFQHSLTDNPPLYSVTWTTTILSLSRTSFLIIKETYQSTSFSHMIDLG